MDISLVDVESPTYSNSFLDNKSIYRTNCGIGHTIKDLLEAHKGPPTDQGHKVLHEILKSSWHAHLSTNLTLLSSFSIIAALILFYASLSIPRYYEYPAPMVYFGELLDFIVGGTAQYKHLLSSIF